MKCSKAKILGLACVCLYYSLKLTPLLEIPKRIFLEYSDCLAKAVEGGYIQHVLIMSLFITVP